MDILGLGLSAAFAELLLFGHTLLVSLWGLRWSNGVVPKHVRAEIWGSAVLNFGFDDAGVVIRVSSGRRRWFDDSGRLRTLLVS